jgi:hypothetical protein
MFPLRPLQSTCEVRLWIVVIVTTAKMRHCPRYAGSPHTTFVKLGNASGRTI